LKINSLSLIFVFLPRSYPIYTFLALFFVNSLIFNDLTRWVVKKGVNPVNPLPDSFIAGTVIMLGLHCKPKFCR